MSARRAVAALLAAALAAPAAAYVRSTSATNGAPLAWPTPAVPYVVSSRAVTQSPSCLADAADGPALAAVSASFAEWEQSCSPLRLVYAGRIDDARIGLGTTGDHLVVFRAGFCSMNPAAAACLAASQPDCAATYNCFDDSGPGDRSVVALTSVLYEPSSGRIVDADIEVNGWDGQGAGSSLSSATHGWYFTCDKRAGWPQCTTYGQASCFYIDLQNTVTHEVGHFIGLAHVCGDPGQPSCTSAFASITMYPNTSPGDLDKRTLAQDDIDGVCAIYPEGHGSAAGGGCASAGGAPAATALLLALAALRRRRAARPR